MGKDIFAEVTRIENEAERILAQARTDRDAILKKAEADAVACREEAERSLADESRRLRAEHERRLAADQAALEEDFKNRKARLEDVSLRRTDPLADWIVRRFLEESR